MKADAIRVKAQIASASQERNDVHLLRAKLFGKPKDTAGVVDGDTYIHSGTGSDACDLFELRCRVTSESINAVLEERLDMRSGLDRGAIDDAVCRHSDIFQHRKLVRRFC